MNRVEKIKILYIDDEVNNLYAFKANLRYDYEVLITSDIEEVWDILNNNQDIRVVFCDKKMPKKDGIELLREIKNCYPNIIRIILTAYTDKNDIINSINRCHIFKYIEKPFDFEEIRNIIESSNQYFLTKINKNIDSVKSENTMKRNTSEYREEIANKLLVINNLIREGYQKTFKKLGHKYSDYLLSVKDSNYYAIKHELINEIKPLVI